MRSRRKIRVAIPLLAVAGCVAVGLSGCSGSGFDNGASAAPKGEPTFNPKSKISLEMSWWGDSSRSDLYGRVIHAFEKKYPNITVKQTPVGSPNDLFQRLTTDFGAGGTSAPDVFALGGAMPQQYGAAGALLNMKTVAKYLDLSAYPKDTLTGGTVKGQLVGLPEGGNATAAFVNTKIFKEAGLTPPSGDWTWSELVKDAETIGRAHLTNAQGKPVYGLDIRSADIIGTFVAQYPHSALYTAAGKVGTTASVLAKWYTVEKKLSTGGGLAPASVVTADANLPVNQQLYTLGQAGITFGYSNLASSYATGGPTKVVSPPTDTGVTGVSLLPSSFWSINAKTTHPAAAALLVSWFLNTPSTAKLILDNQGVQFNPKIAAVVVPRLTGEDKVGAQYVEKVLKTGIVAAPQPNGGQNMNQYTQDGEANVLFNRQTPLQAGQTWVTKLTGDLKAAQANNG